MYHMYIYQPAMHPLDKKLINLQSASMLGIFSRAWKIPHHLYKICLPNKHPKNTSVGIHQDYGFHQPHLSYLEMLGWVARPFTLDQLTAQGTNG